MKFFVWSGSIIQPKKKEREEKSSFCQKIVCEIDYMLGLTFDASIDVCWGKQGCQGG